MKFLCALLLVISFKSYAQYPFEKYPVKSYDSVRMKIIYIDENHRKGLAKYKDFTIKLEEEKGLEGGKILLYKKGKLLNKVDGDFVRADAADFPVYIEDVNNDGKPDLIVETYGASAAGLASAQLYTTCFISKADNTFNVLQFESFYDKPQKEYQFDKNNYLIVGESLADYQNHAYWIFDLYKYKNGRLTNVSKKYNYPIAVPYLNKETFTATNKLPKKVLQHFSLKVPASGTQY